MKDLKAFFSFRNRANEISGSDYQSLSNYIAVAEAFARTSYMSVYLIDYYKKGFDYVSDNPLFLCGLSAREVLEMGYEFYSKFVVEEDMDMLYKINSIGFEYFDSIPVGERLHYTISYDFRLKGASGHVFLVNHKLTPLFLTEDGNIWKSFCLVSLSENKCSGNIRVYKQNEPTFLAYNLAESYWEKLNRVELAEREREILYLSIQGLTINQVAERIFVSTDTVKFHRKKLFEKLGVANITEAISYAINNKLL